MQRDPLWIKADFLSRSIGKSAARSAGPAIERQNGRTAGILAVFPFMEHYECFCFSGWKIYLAAAAIVAFAAAAAAAEDKDDDQNNPAAVTTIVVAHIILPP